MKKSSNVKVDNGAALTSDAVVDMVFELHRKSHHYSLRKLNPELYARILTGCSKVPLKIVLESYKIYKDTENKTDNKIPHPNYFMAICKRMHAVDGKVSKIKTIWGKEL